MRLRFAPLTCWQALALCAAAGAFAPARADPGYYVVTAYSDAGLRTLDLNYWTVKSKSGPATLWPEIGFSLGVNSRWTTGLFVSFIGTRDTAMKLSTLNWQNDILLTQGQFPFDLALHTQWIKNRASADGQQLEFGPVLQTEVGRTQLNGNLFFERTLRAAVPVPTQLKYQWQAKYRWRPAWQFGLQGFGELGPWDHWAPRDRQSHRAGPALFGRLRLGAGNQALIYQAGWLFGSTYGQDGNMFTLRVQYAY